MDLSVKFTKDELELFMKALSFTIIHSENEEELKILKLLSIKIHMLAQIIALENASKRMDVS